eukprot:scaffold8739_cov173-Ochromonas_danica.AAC.2
MSAKFLLAHLDVDNMSEADLRNHLKIILNENTQLKMLNGAITENQPRYIYKIMDCQTMWRESLKRTENCRQCYQYSFVGRTERQPASNFGRTSERELDVEI